MSRVRVASIGQPYAVWPESAPGSVPGTRPGPRPILTMGRRIAACQAAERVAAGCAMKRAALSSGNALPGSGAALFASHDQSASPEASR